MRPVLPVLIALALGASFAIAEDAVDIKLDALLKKPTKGAVKKNGESGSPLRVDGIVNGPDGAFAIIDGRAYLKGEGGEGFLVKDIEPMRVLIESSGGLECLPLKPRERPGEKPGEAREK